MKPVSSRIPTEVSLVGEAEAVKKALEATGAEDERAGGGPGAA